MSVQRRISQTQLVRLLGDWSVGELSPPKQDAAERMSQWLNAFDAVRLDAALHQINAHATGVQTGVRTSMPQAKASPAADLHEAVSRVRSEMAMAMAGVVSGVAPGVDRPGDGEHATVEYTAVHQRHLEMQRTLDSKVGALRAQVRQVMSKAGVNLRLLAALDATLEQMLGAREQKLMASVPVFLERRFEHWRSGHQQRLQATGQADAPASWRQPGGWLHAFAQDWQMLMEAELNVRLLPVVGLVEAFNNEFKDKS